MKNLRNLLLRKTIDEGRPDYYITPTRDFTKYTKDCEEKYWSKDTAFDWNQNVQGNLRERLERLNSEDFSKLAFMTLPMIEETLKRKIVQIQQKQLPQEEDALKGIGECIPFDRITIHRALLVQSPIKGLRLLLTERKDQLEIIQSEILDLREQQRLGFFKSGIKVKHLETDIERHEQTSAITQLTTQLKQIRGEYVQLKVQYEAEATSLHKKVQEELQEIEHQILAELEETRKLLQHTLQCRRLPDDPKDLSRLKDLILKRQLRGLKDIANHALVVEQSAIAPLTIGIIHYKRHREIQEAMTTFINDEAKHSATFRRFLVEKLEAREYISAKLIKGADRYLWLARFMPGTGLFFAVVVEAIGAAVLEFFGNEEYMPDNLFCSICKTITEKDEVRHIGLCVDMYNELFRSHGKWEKVQNHMALRILMKSVYGDKTEDSQLIQAFRAFGIDSKVLYRHIFTRVSQQLTRISMYVEPEWFFQILGRK